MMVVVRLVTSPTTVTRCVDDNCHTQHFAFWTVTYTVHCNAVRLVTTSLRLAALTTSTDHAYVKLVSVPLLHATCGNADGKRCAG